jgi:hypothetical protein
MMNASRACSSLLALILCAPMAHADGITAKPGNTQADFDIVRAEVVTKGDVLRFRMEVSGKAGKTMPAVSGKVAGSTVYSYVWPTKLNSSEVGFEADQGILALAVTAHPDFDDTPLVDENGDGDPKNDGALWHSHWVVLVPDDACGAGALKVKDIPEGAKPKLPATWPGLPILIDSPDLKPAITGKTVEVRVPLKNVGVASGVAYGAVTAGLRVNANLHAPFLCVANVFDVASGNLSLPGKIR